MFLNQLLNTMSCRSGLSRSASMLPHKSVANQRSSRVTATTHTHKWTRTMSGSLMRTLTFDAKHWLAIAGSRVTESANHCSGESVSPKAAILSELEQDQNVLIRLDKSLTSWCHSSPTNQWRGWRRRIFSCREQARHVATIRGGG